jgi:hypothetical protein
VDHRYRADGGGAPGQEEQIDAWQLAWDEVDNLHLEGEEVQADADMTAQRKRPEAWAVSWEKRRLLILEFTRPNDRGELSLHETDLYKTALYKSLLDLLVRLLPGWKVEIQTYMVCIRASHDPDDRWYTQLLRLEVTVAQAERLMQGMIVQALTELTDLYSVQYAALQRLLHA